MPDYTVEEASEKDSSVSSTQVEVSDEMLEVVASGQANTFVGSIGTNSGPAKGCC